MEETIEDIRFRARMVINMLLDGKWDDRSTGYMRMIEGRERSFVAAVKEAITSPLSGDYLNRIDTVAPQMDTDDPGVMRHSTDAENGRSSP